MGRRELSQAIAATWATITGKPTTLAGFGIEVEADVRYKTLEAVIAPTLLNGWVNFGGSWQAAGYYKTPQGEVRILGTVKNGTLGAPVFSLPAGYRPAAGFVLARATVNINTFAVQSQEVHDSGSVTLNGATNTGSAIGFEFRAGA